LLKRCFEVVERPFEIFQLIFAADHTAGLTNRVIKPMFTHLSESAAEARKLLCENVQLIASFVKARSYSRRLQLNQEGCDSTFDLDDRQLGKAFPDLLPRWI
jgi:hypothetical protein